MKPAAYDLTLATSLPDAVAALGAREGAKAVSGGCSLGPMLNLRLARPSLLVDLRRVEALRALKRSDSLLEIGAGWTHGEIEDGVVPDVTAGLMARVAHGIAYRAVRNRGTIGGSLAHADPAADWPIVLTGLGASVRLAGPVGTREMPVTDFLTGPFSTALRPDELLTAIILPRPSKDARWGYWKFCRQVGEFAKASASVLIDPNRLGLRCAVGALGRPPLLLDDPAALIEGRTSPAEALAKALPDRPAEELTLHATALTRALNQAKGEK